MRPIVLTLLAVACGGGGGPCPNVSGRTYRITETDDVANCPGSKGTLVYFETFESDHSCTVGGFNFERVWQQSGCALTVSGPDVIEQLAFDAGTLGGEGHTDAGCSYSLAGVSAN